MRLTPLQKILWACAGIGLVVWLGLIISIDHQGHDTGTLAADESSVFAPTFKLVSDTRQTVTEAAWPGKWLLVFFGFTNCPDICPTTLSDIAAVMDGLGSESDSIQPLFITVDPERDQVENIGRYVEAFHPSIVGLTGDLSAIATAAKSFHVYFEKVQQEDVPDGYTMGHTTAIYLVNPEGEFVRTYTYGMPAEDIVLDLKVRL